MMIMEHWWNDDMEKTEVLKEKPVPLPLCPPHISQRLAWDRTRATADTNRPNHVTAARIVQ